MQGGKSFIDNVLKEAKGWNVIASRTFWDANDYDLTTVMKKVHIDFWMDSLFRVTITPDRLDSSINAIQVGN